MRQRCCTFLKLSVVTVPQPRQTEAKLHKNEIYSSKLVVTCISGQTLMNKLFFRRYTPATTHLTYKMATVSTV